MVHATIALLRRERELPRELEGQGRTVAEAQESILADAEVQRLRATITGGDAKLDDAFAIYLVDWFVMRVFAEADGPLDDSIPARP